MTPPRVRAPEPQDLDSIHRLLCDDGRLSGPLRGVLPHGAAVADMVSRSILPMVVLDAAGHVQSYLYGYGLDRVGQESIRLGLCAADTIAGTPMAVIGVARWAEALRTRYPLARIFLEGPAARFTGGTLSDVLKGPLVLRHDALWNGSGFEPYELWELDIPKAIDLVDRLGTKPAHTSRRRRLTKAELSQELARQLEWEHSDPGHYTSLDSLGMVELLVTIADLAGTDPPRRHTHRTDHIHRRRLRPLPAPPHR